MKGFLTAVSLSFATLFDFFVHSSGITGCFFMGYSPRNLGKRKGGGKTKIEDGIFGEKVVRFLFHFLFGHGHASFFREPAFQFFFPTLLLFQHSCPFTIYSSRPVLE